jgi:uncharacterized protein YkwD
MVLAATSLAACTSVEPRSAVMQVPSVYRSLAQTSAQIDAETARDMFSAYRGNKGLEPWILDEKLQDVAAAEARAMAKADKPKSADVVKARLVGAGFTSPAANLSAGYHTLAEAFSGWRDSPQHNRVLLDARTRRMGIATAYAPGTKYKVYWVLVTAAR